MRSRSTTSARPRATRSAARSASPAATTSCSSSTPTSIVRRNTADQQRQPDPAARADPGRAQRRLLAEPRSERRADSTRCWTRLTRQPYPGNVIPAGACISPASRCSSATRCRTGRRPRARTTTTNSPPAGQEPDPAAGDPPRLPAQLEAAADWQVLGSARARLITTPGLIPGFTDVTRRIPTSPTMRSRSTTR